jgi:hypothetical protein
MQTADDLIKKALVDRAATVTDDNLRYSDLRPVSTARRTRFDPAAKPPRFWWTVTATALATVAVAIGASVLIGETHQGAAPGRDISPAAPVQTRTLKAPSAYCLHTPTPRAGTATKMVPARPTSVTICTHVPQRPATTITNVSGLVAALDALPTQPISGGCQARSPSALPAVGTYELHFHYASGPDVLVNVLPHCRPSMNNLELQTASSTTVVPLIEQAIASSGTTAPSSSCEGTGFHIGLVKDSGGAASPVQAAKDFNARGGVPGFTAADDATWHVTGPVNSGVGVSAGNLTLHAIQFADKTWAIVSGNRC